MLSASVSVRFWDESFDVSRGERVQEARSV